MEHGPDVKDDPRLMKLLRHISRHLDGDYFFNPIDLSMISSSLGILGVNPDCDLLRRVEEVCTSRSFRKFQPKNISFLVPGNVN